MNPDDRVRLRNLMRRVERARDFPENTCGASRHLHIIAKRLAAGKPYPMLTEEPEHCAETMLSVLESLWKARTELAKAKPAPLVEVVEAVLKRMASNGMSGWKEAQMLRKAVATSGGKR